MLLQENEKSLKKRVKNLFKKQSSLSVMQQILILTPLIVGAIFILIPFFWMISTSLKNELQVWEPGIWIPNPIDFANYIEPFQTLPFFTFFKNTMIIVLVAIIAVPLSSAFVAYGFARFKAKGSKILFMVLLATMMLPGQVTLIPMFILFKNLGWYNTVLPLTVPLFFGIPFYIFLLRQFFMGIPKEMEEAATIDGCGTFRIWWQILLPMTKPALATVVIFEFLGKWNDFFGPLIYLESMEKFTLALGLRMFQTQYITEYGPTMALSTLLMAPCVILFFFASKYFIKGINISGAKG